MMLRGVIRKGKHPGWAASCELLGAFTQGTNRKDACEALADAVETIAGRDTFKVRVTETGKLGDDEYEVLIDSDQPEVLAATVLRQQREYHQLSLSDVAKKLGVSSISSYAAYEQGTRAPSLAKFRELLGAVAPELALTIGPRKAGAR